MMDSPSTTPQSEQWLQTRAEKAEAENAQLRAAGQKVEAENARLREELARLKERG